MRQRHLDELVEAGLLAPEHPALVLLQPRRVAARAAAERIADENGWTLGEEVGYHVRFDRKVGRRTRIRVAYRAEVASGAWPDGDCPSTVAPP